MAVCYAHSIEYIGPYKYTMDLSLKLKDRLQNIKIYNNLKHIAHNNNIHDFSASDTYISCKTVKKRPKVAPQVIGQPSLEKLCSFFLIEDKSPAYLKLYIQENPYRLLQLMTHYTFQDCELLYYNKHKDKLYLIKLVTDIPWSNYEYIFTKNHTNWTNSSTLKIKIESYWISLAEIQFHNTRKNLALRWCFENLLSTMKSHFDIKSN